MVAGVAHEVGDRALDRRDVGEKGRTLGHVPLDRKRDVPGRGQPPGRVRKPRREVARVDALPPHLTRLAARGLHEQAHVAVELGRALGDGTGGLGKPLPRRTELGSLLGQEVGVGAHHRERRLEVVRERGHLLAGRALGAPARLERLGERGAHPLHGGKHVVNLAHVAPLHREVQLLARDPLGRHGERGHLAGDHAGGAARHQRHGTHAERAARNEHEVLRVGQGVAQAARDVLGHVRAREHAHAAVLQREHGVGGAVATDGAHLVRGRE